MKEVKSSTLSSSITVRRKRRLTPRPTIPILLFIYRYRHVTAHHIQTHLGHSTISATNTHLRKLLALGYVARHYNLADKKSNRPASYYLTPLGLTFLRKSFPKQKFVGVRQLHSDAVANLQRRMRFHMLADLYIHFKKYPRGIFGLHTAKELAGVEDMPNELPDGYLQITTADKRVEFYFIEIYGWNRSTQNQSKRLRSYVDYAQDRMWDSDDDEIPTLLILTSSYRAQARVKAQIKHHVENSLISEMSVFTTTTAELDKKTYNIWKKIHFE